MKYTVLFAAVTALFAGSAVAGGKKYNMALENPDPSKAVTVCVRGKHWANGKCVKNGKLRVRSEGSDDYFEIPDAADAHWEGEE